MSAPPEPRRLARTRRGSAGGSGGAAAGCPARRTACRAGRARRQQVVEAGAGHEEQAVRGAGAGHGEPAEGGVELVELVGAGERVDRDGDAVRLALPGVDGGGREHVRRAGRASRCRRSTMSVASSTAWLRVARTTTRGSPVRVAEDSTRRLRRVTRRRRTSRSTMAKPAASSGRRAAPRALEQRQVDVGGLGVGSPSTSRSVGPPVATCAQTSAAGPVECRAARCERSPGAATQSSSVPVAVERPPQRELLGGRAPDRRQVDGERASRVARRRSATRGTGCSRGRRATGSRSGRSAGSWPTSPTPTATGRVALDAGEQVERQLPRLVDEQHVEDPSPLAPAPRSVEHPAVLAEHAELVRDAEDDADVLGDVARTSSRR